MISLTSLKISVFFFCIIAVNGEWKNTCGDASGDKVLSAQVGDYAMSPTNCTINKGKKVNINLDFSVAQESKDISVVCEGTVGKMKINLFKATKTCKDLKKSLLPGGKAGSDSSSCTSLNPGVKYTFSQAYSCPKFIPVPSVAVSCTSTNDKKVQTHCVSFSCTFKK